MPDYAVNQDVINKAKDLIQSGWCQAVFGLFGAMLSWTVWCQAVFGLLGVRLSWTVWCQAVVQVMWDAIISLYNHC